MNIIKQHLPEYCYDKRNMESVDAAAIHFISAMNVLPDDPFNREAILKILKDYKFSANYLVERDGTFIEIAPLNRRTYHAGKSIMNGREDCNDFAIGIELVGGTKWPYTDEQILNLAEFLAQNMTEHQYTIDWVKGHDEIRNNWNMKYPNDRRSVKVDPGPHFPWGDLKEMLSGIGEA